MSRGDVATLRSLRAIVWVSLLASVVALLLAPVAGAATIPVNTTTDEVTPSDGLCSLREALGSADFNSSDDCIDGEAASLDTVQLDAATYDLSAPFGVILLQNPLDVGGVAIVGEGMSVTDIRATPTFDSQILATQAPAALALTDLTIEGGETTSFGGAISVISNSLTLTRVRVANNTASFGGGVYFQPNTTDHPNAALTITDSVIDGNIATSSSFTQSFGGGVDTLGKTVITDSTISGNSVLNAVTPTSTGGGGGVFGDGTSDLVLVGNLITGNTVDTTGTARGGGIEARGTLTAVNDTLTGNSVVTATTRGGGALRYEGFSSPAGLTNVTIAGNTATTSPGIDSSNPVALRNSIVDDGTAACAGSLTTLGGNVDHGSSCWAVGGAGDLQDTDPILGTLADNGGPTMTMGLLSGSPAIDRVPVGSCVDQQSTPQPVTTDQRGISRPQGPACDSGAFEVVQPPVAQPPAPPPPSLTPPGPIATGQRAAALKRCKKKFRHNKAKLRKCRKKAKRLPL
jgi:CSLREA domain-containing protein